MKNKRDAATQHKPPRLSRTHAPDDMAPADWQRALRRQFGREQPFSLENLGTDAFFSEFRIGNPESKSHYRVAIRGTRPGDNFCACPDYATNELGTCKHIEFTLSKLMSKRGAKAAFARGYQPAFSELYLRNDGGRTIHFRAGTDCPAKVADAAAALFDVSDGWRLPEACFDELRRFLTHVAKAGHELRAYDDALDFIAGRSDALRRAAMLNGLFPGGAADPQLRKLLKVPLYAYQAEGALFAVRAGRALIGDEMGLGKTVQAIAAAEILARHAGVSKVLVVCPTSLKYQWQSEIARFSGRASRVIAGNLAQRRSEYAEEDFCKITNYEKLKYDLDTIAAWAPELVIVDEAQRIKNWNTVAAKALKRIDSPYCVVLTGTPLENKMEELISIVQFVDQHRLGPTWKLLHEHQVKDEAGRVTGYTGLDMINQTLAPIMIRRRKSEVLRQLPKRTDQNLLVPMTEQQMAHHAENAETAARIVHRWRKLKFLSDRDQRRLTCALQNMRMSCNSTYLLDQETDHGVKADELAVLFETLLAEPGAKAVVFSQWTRTHEIVIRRLERLGVGYVSFHGGVPSERRPALVERFRDDPDCRVFLSTDAGSTGLNLQHASTLVNMDLPWNPAVLEQRIARIYRMGQRKPVQIVNYVAKGTIEEGMLSVLAFKRSLMAGILDGGAGDISLGGSRLARFMKDVETVTGRMGEGDALADPEESAVAGVEADIDADAEPAAADADAAAAAADVDASADAAPGGRSEEARDAQHLADDHTHSGVAAAEPVWRDVRADPWSGLLQFGVELVSALNASAEGTASTHPWVERNPTTGARSLRLPLPPPDTARRLADALSAISSALRSGGVTAEAVDTAK
ncbi:ATP-dependent helicase [Burkholderia sp. Bp9031]|uniref:DEAD/DEAH box helicase n=1 Tax=Burkholderia sp. Bp9031 TaxID=2184566 RepID=UPI000F5F3E90|nr:DEAD/DEAH box helicase [Burkholderia sp. Bp9031]RQZ17706.1 ATP-dependent helicase [Burkholderia sp. Bp9031]